MPPSSSILGLLALVAGAAQTALGQAGAPNWPAFRGPTGDGRADAGARPPLHWSETRNLAWKTAVPHHGWSSPLVWGRQVWLTSATADGRQMFALCFDLDNGRLERQVKVFDTAEPQPIYKNLNNYAAPTGAIEAGRLYVHFGTHGTACLDTASGDKLWERRDLTLDHKEGAGASVLLYGGLLIFDCDGQDVQYIIALDKATGKTAWKTARSIDFGTLESFHKKAYSTPVVRTVGGKPVLFSVGGHAAYAYDPATGRELWRARHPGWSNIARPVFADGLVYINTGFARPELWAIRADGVGDVSLTHIAWKLNRGVPTQSSPLLLDGLMYLVSDGGVLTCLEAAGGTQVRQHRLGGNFSASPVLAEGRIHWLSLEGRMTVIGPGRTLEQLAVNELTGTFKASPAAVGRSLLLRSATHLYCVREPEPARD
jgi:outer membrane protein assembly factor BamB